MQLVKQKAIIGCESGVGGARLGVSDEDKGGTT